VVPLPIKSQLINKVDKLSKEKLKNSGKVILNSNLNRTRGTTPQTTVAIMPR